MSLCTPLLPTREVRARQQQPVKQQQRSLHCSGTVCSSNRTPGAPTLPWRQAGAAAWLRLVLASRYTRCPSCCRHPSLGRQLTAAWAVSAEFGQLRLCTTAGEAGSFPLAGARLSHRCAWLRNVTFCCVAFDFTRALRLGVLQIRGQAPAAGQRWSLRPQPPLATWQVGWKPLQRSIVIWLG